MFGTFSLRLLRNTVQKSNCSSAATLLLKERSISTTCILNARTSVKVRQTAKQHRRITFDPQDKVTQASPAGIYNRVERKKCKPLEQENKRERILAKWQNPAKDRVIYDKPDDKQVWVSRFCGANVGLTQLRGDVFNVRPRLHAIEWVIRWQLAKRRSKGVWVKTKAEVSGTGRKPYPQKGRGKARHGSLRNPQFRGGGVAHGPRGRDHEFKLNKKIRKLGLRNALTQKLASGDLTIIDNLPVLKGNPSIFKTYLTRRGLSKRRTCLLVGADPLDYRIRKGTLDIPFCTAMSYRGLNVYDVVRFKEVIIDKKALDAIQSRLKTFD